MVTSRRTQIGMRKPTNPCMIIWPAIVPTAELDTPEAISETQEHAGRPGAEQRRQRVIGGLDLRDVAVAGMEGARRHHHHRHVDQAGDGQRDDDLAVGKAQHRRRSPSLRDRRARLRQAGMQIDARAASRSRRRCRRRAAAPRRRRAAASPYARRRAPIDRRDEHFDRDSRAPMTPTRAPMTSSIGRKPSPSNIRMP